ncbi:MAG: hypothetical protein J0J02_09055 [Thiobacillus sp.]|uniref:hypothetical protein n=1 Tax=Thiobacillus sp. 63-78 TaxID=1895859 RepID=UPI001ACC9072|nr:hypothetical protein [Thiobacillus sp. 63-78]MBN8762644.1 hypothetical protein [Thiobacillus sp.]MBN8774202.1 hypothetical protein [Thiobacillus sp.]
MSVLAATAIRLQGIAGSAREGEKEPLNKSFDKLRTNGKLLIPFVVSLSNHERDQLVQGFQKEASQAAHLHIMRGSIIVMESPHEKSHCHAWCHRVGSEWSVRLRQHE